MEQDFMLMMSEQNQIARIVDTNRYTERFGLMLSEEEAAMLVKERSHSLKEQQRVEFGKAVDGGCDLLCGRSRKTRRKGTGSSDGRT